MKTHWGFSHNGQMTTFTLESQTDKSKRWYICRDDLEQLVNGVFDFDDDRPSIDLSDEAKESIRQQAIKELEFVKSGGTWMTFSENYRKNFEASPGSLGRLGLEDLGRKFMYRGEPFAFVGTKKRARKYKVAAENLLTGRIWGFVVSAVEEAFGKPESAQS